jgi:hypothetical protein
VDQMTGWLCRQAGIDGGWQPNNPVRRPVGCRYDAAVPELSAGLPRIADLPWESLSHRQVLAELAAAGWVPCGVGDWAVALRSPEGSLVARVCPFDPAYWAFVDLCRECAGNRWLPRIELAAGLEGGGLVVFLEYVAPVDHPVVKQFAEQWQARTGDAEFQEVRRAEDRRGVPEVDAVVGWVRFGRRPHLQSRRPAGAARRLLHGWDGAVRCDPRRRRRGAPPDSAGADCATPWTSRISPGRTAPPRSLPSKRPGHALPNDPGGRAKKPVQP